MIKRFSNKIGKIEFDFWTIVIILAFLSLFFFMIIPFFRLFTNSFIDPETNKFSLQYYIDFFNIRYYFLGLGRSLLTATISMIGAVLIGLPLSYIHSRYNIYGKKLLSIMTIMSLLSPPFIGAYSWIILLGRNGIITNGLSKLGINIPSIYGFKGIVLVLSLNLFPHVYLYVSGALKNIDPSLEEAAENLGVSKLKGFFTITLPLIFPTITSAALLVFMNAIAGLGTPMLIGEGYKVLPVMIYEEYMNDLGGNVGMASAISVLLVLITTIILIIQKFIVNRKDYKVSTIKSSKIERLNPIPRILLTIVSFIITTIAMLPQIVVFVSSFKNTNGPVWAEGWGLDSYRSALISSWSNIRNTFLFSTITIIIIVVIGVLVSYVIVRKRNVLTSILDIMIMVPYVMPGAVLAIALIVAFNSEPILLTGTTTILIISYTIRKLPYTIRSSTAILHQIDSSVEEVSISLGVSPAKTFIKITSVLMAPGVLSGAILSWVTTINELSSSILLHTGKTATISVAIYNSVISSSYGTAAALGSILSLIIIVSIVLIMKISDNIFDRGFQ